jgi:predicted ATPase/class 3 adenylate cyclase
MRHDSHVGRNLPSGTVTFLFTDVEGSTRLLHALGAEGYADALGEHRRLLRQAFTAHGGVEVDTQGDAFFVAFPTAPGALAAASEAREALATGPIRVRIGLHTGTPHLTDEGYVGADVHRAARIAAAGHGGQILVSAATAQLVDASELRDLGLHRLKDLTAPERIYQLGPAEHPPLKTLHQTNLPVPATPFLGREAELAELAALLVRDDVRLVTLTGPGGSGKTRLALQAAAEAADAFPGGVWWVPLAALRDPALVLESATTALGASADIAEHIGDTRLLLLLDNFEHLTQAASNLAPLVSRSPNLTLLVTSREPLHLSGEHEYAVDPLLPDEAVELFLTRAVAAKRDFSANGEVAAICARLDHLPLAIELAAARVKVLSPAALLARLEQRLPVLTGGTRDAPDRQRTLRATIEWSHELLTDDEQRLFARLAVFRGGCTLEAAEAVVDADLDSLQSLVDKNLIRVRDSGRFWMLETIREFALERLAASGEEAMVRRRHRDVFLTLAESLDPVRHMAGIRALVPERNNLRAALRWSLDADAAAEETLRLAYVLWRYWLETGSISEGHAWLTEALDRAEDVDTPMFARALDVASLVAAEKGDFAAALALSGRALAVAEALGDTGALLGWILCRRGQIEIDRGVLGEAAAVLERALEIFVREEHASPAAWTLIELGRTALLSGDTVTAAGRFREAAAIAETDSEAVPAAYARALLGCAQAFLGTVGDGIADVDAGLEQLRALGASFTLTIALLHSAPAYRLTAEDERERETVREAIRLSLDNGVVPRATACLEAAARLATDAGQPANAARLWGASDRIMRQLGVIPSPLRLVLREALEPGARSTLGEGAFEQEHRGGAALGLPAALEVALEIVDALEPIGSSSGASEDAPELARASSTGNGG